MNKKTMGIHHITAIVGHPQENVDFYAGVLSAELQSLLEKANAKVELYWGNRGHQLTMEEVEAVANWYKEHDTWGKDD